MSKRVPAAGNVQRGLFYLDKGDVWGLFFPLPSAAITHFTFPSSERAGGTRKQSGVKGLGSQKPREDLSFFFSPPFLLLHWIFFGIT